MAAVAGWMPLDPSHSIGDGGARSAATFHSQSPLSRTKIQSLVLSSGASPPQRSRTPGSTTISYVASSPKPIFGEASDDLLQETLVELKGLSGTRNVEDDLEDIYSMPVGSELMPRRPSKGSAPLYLPSSRSSSSLNMLNTNTMDSPHGLRASSSHDHYMDLLAGSTNRYRIENALKNPVSSKSTTFENSINEPDATHDSSLGFPRELKTGGLNLGGGSTPAANAVTRIPQPTQPGKLQRARSDSSIKNNLVTTLDQQDFLRPPIDLPFSSLTHSTGHQDTALLHGDDSANWEVLQEGSTSRSLPKTTTRLNSQTDVTESNGDFGRSARNRSVSEGTTPKSFILNSPSRIPNSPSKGRRKETSSNAASQNSGVQSHSLSSSPKGNKPLRSFSTSGNKPKYLDSYSQEPLPPWVATAAPLVFRSDDGTGKLEYASVGVCEGTSKIDNLVLPAVARRLESQRLMSPDGIQHEDQLIEQWGRDGTPTKIADHKFKHRPVDSTPGSSADQNTTSPAADENIKDVWENNKSELAADRGNLFSKPLAQYHRPTPRSPLDPSPATSSPIPPEKDDVVFLEEIRPTVKLSKKSSPSDAGETSHGGGCCKCNIM